MPSTQPLGAVQQTDTYDDVLADSAILAEATANLRAKAMAGDLPNGIARTAIRNAALLLDTVANYQPAEPADD